jgi:hypothetical protein
MSKHDRITEYNRANALYNITDIKRMSTDDIANYKKWGKSSLYELYDRPSDAKVTSYRDILATYDPREIITVQGSCHSYSVILQAGNGDYLHITKCNNYLIDITEG